MKQNKKYTVLYVDDEESNLRVFKNSFRRDFNILLANNAIEALKMMEANHIDVVVTDQIMPEITGVELLQKINDKYPQFPPSRLMISGYAQPNDIEKAFDEYHLYQFIAKPWKQKDLFQIIIQSIKNNHE